VSTATSAPITGRRSLPMKTATVTALWSPGARRH
jgi:hypothetical protein